MLTVKQLSRPFPSSPTKVVIREDTQSSRVWLYRGVNLRFKSSEIYAVIGPNGAGKSTLLRDLAGLCEPFSGQVEVEDRDLQRIKPRLRARKIAYLPQLSPLVFEITVEELVMLGRTPYRHRLASPGATDWQAVEWALAQTDLFNVRKRKVQTLSGGELRRAMLARMLATQASILILDEPTTALDISYVLDFFQICRKLALQGCTVIIAMHELTLARAHADWVVLLPGDGSGSVVSGPAAQVLTSAYLEPIFHVRVQERDGQLLFALENAEGSSKKGLRGGFGYVEDHNKSGTSL